MTTVTVLIDILTTLILGAALYLILKFLFGMHVLTVLTCLYMRYSWMGTQEEGHHTRRHRQQQRRVGKEFPLKTLTKSRLSFHTSQGLSLSRTWNELGACR
jgi:hypothetical protein